MDVLNEPICYSEFYQRYLLANKPCLLAAKVTESWLCRQLWVENGRPKWDYLKQNYGNT